VSDASEARLSSLVSILRGGSIYAVGTLIARGVGFVLTLVLVRGLGTTSFGLFVLARRFVQMAAGLADLGGDKAVLRFVPKYEDDPRRRGTILGLCLLTSLLVSVGVAAALAAGAPLINAYTLEHPLFPDVIRVFAIVLPFYTLRRVVTAGFRGLEKLEYTVGINRVAFPVAQVLSMGAALLLGATVVGVVAAAVVSGVVLLALSVAVLVARTDLRPRLQGATDVGREYYDYSLPLTVSQAGGMIYSNVDVLMLGVFVSAADVGIYHVALALASLLALPLMATNQVFPPVASRLYDQGSYDDLEAIYGFLTRWVFGAALLAGVALIVFREPVLALFGTEVTAGASVLAVLAAAKLANVAVGPSGYLLMMTDHQYVKVVNQLATATLNVVLNYVLILRYGLIGAAVATAVATAVMNLARLVEVWWYEGLVPYSWATLKPVGAVAVAAVAMVWVGEAFGSLSGIALVLSGGLVGLGAFATVLGLLGVEGDDRELVEWTLAELGD
jgi:O-antigen/teichoic acid export membrane protein